MSRLPAHQRNVPTTRHTAPLSGDFGYRGAVWAFGQDAVDSLPRFTRGPNAGKPKGFLIWLKTDRAGYHVNAGGGAKAGQTVRTWIGAGEYSGEADALRGTWFGRTQNLCGSAWVLGPKAREREAAQIARDAADREAGFIAREA